MGRVGAFFSGLMFLAAASPFALAWLWIMIYLYKAIIRIAGS